MTESAQPDAIEPDTKDWTWTLRETCPQCGFTAAEVRGPQVAERVEALTDPWRDVLARPDARERPNAQTWSPLEYACHVRDVHRVFGERLHRMLTEDDPLFDNWDQDAAAVEGRYTDQDPGTVAAEVEEETARVAQQYAAVSGAGWERPGRRSNG